MNLHDFLKKISSRKFWSMVAGLVTSIAVLLNVDENTTAQIVAVVGALGTIVIYILAEAYVDGKREQKVDAVYLDKESFDEYVIGEFTGENDKEKE